VLLKAFDGNGSVVSCHDHHFFVDRGEFARLESCGEVDTVVERLSHVKLIEKAHRDILAEERLDGGPGRIERVIFVLLLHVICLLKHKAQYLEQFFGILFQNSVVFS